MTSEITLDNVTIGENYAPNQFKNIYMSLSTALIKNSLFYDTSALYTSEELNNPKGGFIYCSDSTLDIQSSEFKDGIADEGGAIYSVLSTVSIANTMFTNNTAMDTGGAISSLENILFSIDTGKFNQNKADIGASINIESSTVQDAIINTEFLSGFNPKFLHFLSAQVTVDNCTFEQNGGYDPSVLSSTTLATLKKSNAIASEGSKNITVINSLFKNMLSQSGTLTISEISENVDHGNM